MNAAEIAQKYHDERCASSSLHRHYTKGPSTVARITADSDGMMVELENGESFEVGREDVVRVVPEAAAFFERCREKSLLEKLVEACVDQGALAEAAIHAGGLPDLGRGLAEAREKTKLARERAETELSAALEIVVGSVQSAIDKASDAPASCESHLREAIATLKLLGAKTDRVEVYSQAAAAMLRKLRTGK